MKKLVLGLFATIMFGFAGNAQAKLSANEKAVVDSQMISLVRLVNSTVYQKGMTQAEFFKLAGPERPSKDESVLLQKLFQYSSTGTTDCNIMREDNSVLVTIAEAGTVSESVPANKWPWHLILEAVIAVIQIFLPSIP
jgi:hypothetical protein